MVPICRTPMTSTVEDSRAMRLTSLTTRVISSAEWICEWKDSDMPWMWL